MDNITEYKDEITERTMAGLREVEERCVAQQERVMSLIRPDTSRALDDLRRLANEVEDGINRMRKKEEEKAESAGKPIEKERAPDKKNAYSSEGDKPAAVL